MAKAPKTIQEQIELLKGRNMAFLDEANAPHFLANISYYRLKGYWWEMQVDKVNHRFADGSYFEDALDLYNFDRHFRLIVFNEIFPILSAILYLSNQISPGHHIKTELLELFDEFEQVPLYKMGFPKAWKEQPIWKNEDV